MEKKTNQKQPASSPTQPQPHKRHTSFTRLVYRDRPLFGIDITASSLRVMQIRRTGKGLAVVGYGASDIAAGVIDNGVIAQPEQLAQALQSLLKTGVQGAIKVRRAALTIPSRRCFVRGMTVPNIVFKDLAEAAQLEVEQYVPMPINQLYVDYTITRQSNTQTEILIVAAPQTIVDSYLTCARLAGIEVVLIEPTITANARLFTTLEQTTGPTILIDFGLSASDVMVFDQSLIMASMIESTDQASPGPAPTTSAAPTAPAAPAKSKPVISGYKPAKSTDHDSSTPMPTPQAEQLVQEIKRTLRYYSDYNNNARQIEQIALMSNTTIPDLSNYLHDALKLPVRTFEPWQTVTMNRAAMQGGDKNLFTAAAGAALAKPKELFR